MAAPVSEPRGYYIGLAYFATGLYVALLVAGFGFLSLLLDIEVIDETDAGPIVGPAMVVVASAVLLLGLLRLGKRLSASASSAPFWAAWLIGIACGFAWILAGALAYSINAEAAENFVEFALHNTVRPFLLVVVLVAAVLALIYGLMVIRRVHGASRPGWPWERDDQGDSAT